MKRLKDIVLSLLWPGALTGPTERWPADGDGRLRVSPGLWSLRHGCSRIGQHFAELGATDFPVRMIALTQAGFPAALEFADDFDWHVEIPSVSGLGMSSAERHPISRTPWVFVFDSTGVLRLQVHGADLDQVEKTLALLSRAPNALHYTQTESRNP